MEQLYFSMREVDQLNTNQLGLEFIQRIIVIGEGLFFTGLMNIRSAIYYHININFVNSHFPTAYIIQRDILFKSGLWFMFHLSVLLSGIMILLAFLICGIVCYQLRTKKITAWSTSTLPRKRRPVESSWNGSARYTNGSNNNGSRRNES